jgi:HSP20 family protein
MPITSEKSDSQLRGLLEETEAFMAERFGHGPCTLADEEVFSPKLEMSETNEQVVISAELPGLEMPDVRVWLHGDLLSISGEKKTKTDYKERHTWLCERSYGSFTRCVRLPADVNAGRITTTLENGILRVCLPHQDVR